MGEERELIILSERAGETIRLTTQARKDAGNLAVAFGPIGYGEPFNTQQRVAIERLAACWNAMLGIHDPAATMKEVREVLEALEDYFDNRADADQAPGDTPTPNEEMRHQVAIRALLAKLEGK